MKMILKAAFFLASLVFSGSAFSCQFNTDCQVGSQCLKQSGSLYGVCAGGMSPGNSNDRVPVQAPIDINKTYGNTCSFNTDCGPGSTCMKSGIYGVCVKK